MWMARYTERSEHRTRPCPCRGHACECEYRRSFLLYYYGPASQRHIVLRSSLCKPEEQWAHCSETGRLRRKHVCPLGGAEDAELNLDMSSNKYCEGAIDCILCILFIFRPVVCSCMKTVPSCSLQDENTRMCTVVIDMRCKC